MGTFPGHQVKQSSYGYVYKTCTCITYRYIDSFTSSLARTQHLHGEPHLQNQISSWSNKLTEYHIHIGCLVTVILPIED